MGSDVALLQDEEYLKGVKEFAGNMDAFNEAFDDAGFDLTTTYGSGTWSASAKCDSGSFPEGLRSKASLMRNDDEQLIALPEEHPRGVNAMMAGIPGAILGVVGIFAYLRRHRANHEMHERL